MQEYTSNSDAYLAHRHDLRNDSFGLLFGVLVLWLAIYWTRRGEVWIPRTTEFDKRSENPTAFWLQVAVYYLIAIGSIGYYGFQVLQILLR